MNYEKIYNRLIQSAFGRLREDYEYLERHHITPLCIGGVDDDSNIVLLTAREHFVAHQLLTKIHPDTPSLIYAAHRMTLFAEHQRDRSKNRMYSWLKNRLYAAQSAKLKGKSWEEIYGAAKAHDMKERLAESKRGKTHSAQHIRNNSEAQKRVPKDHLHIPVLIDGEIYRSRTHAAKELGVDQTTVYRWIKAGKARNI